jgi:hypothetical protein
MQRDRSRLISVEISEQAKKIYDQQPHKGEFVSDAIIEKHGRSESLEAKVKDLESKVKFLMEKLEEVRRRGC